MEIGRGLSPFKEVGRHPQKRGGGQSHKGDFTEKQGQRAFRQRFLEGEVPRRRRSMLQVYIDAGKKGKVVPKVGET